MADIQRADRRSRKFAILALAGILFGGVVLSVQFESWMDNMRSMPVEAARESLMTVFSWSVGIGTVAICLTGCHFWWWGRRVRHALRFPPPGATILRDTVVLEGEQQRHEAGCSSSLASCSSSVPSFLPLGRGGYSECSVLFMVKPLSRADRS
ncbi:MAG: hypothetical protein ACT4PN_01065 [Nitrospiraceae bacterium]